MDKLVNMRNTGRYLLVTKVESIMYIHQYQDQRQQPETYILVLKVKEIRVIGDDKNYIWRFTLENMIQFIADMLRLQEDKTRLQEDKTRFILENMMQFILDDMMCLVCRIYDAVYTVGYYLADIKIQVDGEKYAISKTENG
eukprot:369624_1